MLLVHFEGRNEQSGLRLFTARAEFNLTICWAAIVKNSPNKPGENTK